MLVWWGSLELLDPSLYTVHRSSHQAICVNGISGTLYSNSSK